MARHPVAQLWVQSQGALVRVESQPTEPTELAAGGDRDDLRHWAERAPISARALVLAGLALAGTGLVLGSVVNAGLLLAVVFGGMLTLGGGVTMLGMLKHRHAQRESKSPELKPLAAAPPASVSAERRRRVVATLEQHGNATFEGLMRRLGWTERALLETLVEMKANGVIEEDLNLDTGEWMYRIGDLDAAGTAGSLMLADRQMRAGLEP